MGVHDKTKPIATTLQNGFKGTKGEELQLDAETDYDITAQFSRKCSTLIYPNSPV
jgi:hypothetical protein